MLVHGVQVRGEVADARLEVRRHGVRRRRALLQRVRARLQRLRDESHVADTVADLLHRGPHGLLEGRGGAMLDCIAFMASCCCWMVACCCSSISC